MVNWVGILDGFEKHEAREERKDNKAFKERQKARLEDELNESKFLHRSKTLLEYLDGRGSSIKVDTGKLIELKTLLGDIPEANDYLAKLKASPYALDAVYSALQKRSNNVGIPTGQELMDNITLIAENYGSESWMQQYTEGRDIHETITLNPDKLLEDRFYLETKSRISDLTATVTPTDGFQVSDVFTSNI